MQMPEEKGDATCLTFFKSSLVRRESFVILDQLTNQFNMLRHSNMLLQLSHLNKQLQSNSFILLLLRSSHSKAMQFEYGMNIRLHLQVRLSLCYYTKEPKNQITDCVCDFKMFRADVRIISVYRESTWTSETATVDTINDAIAQLIAAIQTCHRPANLSIMEVFQALADVSHGLIVTKKKQTRGDKESMVPHSMQCDNDDVNTLVPVPHDYVESRSHITRHCVYSSIGFGRENGDGPMLCGHTDSSLLVEGCAKKKKRNEFQ